MTRYILSRKELPVTKGEQGERLTGIALFLKLILSMALRGQVNVPVYW